MKQYAFSAVCFGEVLWDILPSGALPGGAPMNVAYHLNKCGVVPALITRVGKDEKGQQLLHLLQDAGLTTVYFQTDTQQPTGLVYANTNHQHEVAYDIVFPSAWDFIQWSGEAADLVAGSEYFVFGSLASRHDVSRATLLRLLERANKKVLDINLRPPHVHRPTIEPLLEQATILKMNSAELALISGWYGQAETPQKQMELLQHRFSTDIIVVTRGAEGAMLLQQGNLYTCPGVPVTVADTIGSGDAFLAGLLSQLHQGAGMEQALLFACSLGSFVATRSGACPDYHLNEVEAAINYVPSLSQ